MMMLQNPGSDSDQEGEGQIEGSEQMKSQLNEDEAQTKSIKIGTAGDENSTDSHEANSAKQEEDILNESKSSTSSHQGIIISLLN